MAQDIAYLAATRICNVICIDAHLGNVGFYASPKQDLSDRALPRFTTRRGGQQQIVDQPPLITRVVSGSAASVCEPILRCSRVEQRGRNVGSVHSDIWSGSAAGLAGRDKICIYPMAGWWKHNKKCGRSPASLAKEFGPTAWTISLWNRQAKRDGGKGDGGLTTPEREPQFYADGPGRLWVADITYIPTWSGFLYLAMVLDVYSRRIVGWSMDTHLRTELILAALNMAITQRRPSAVIHHSDRGCQYTSYAFGKRCREAGVMPSMGSVGDAYDNAMAESFFATLEREYCAN
jgi:hypothetical protein